VVWTEIPARKVALVARGGERLADVRLEAPLTFLLGSEREGLPESLVAEAHKATVPTPGQAESLNVAAAGAIALYELARRSAT
jgi:TrmH family RNA methyltransferase